MESSVSRLIRELQIQPPTNPRDKVRTLNEVAAAVDQLRHAGRVVVQAHGTFDLLHLGHVRHLEAARKLGDALIVTVTADRFVNKGPGRPVFNAELRAEMLATLAYVDWVAINDAADAVSAIEQIGQASTSRVRIIRTRKVISLEKSNSSAKRWRHLAAASTSLTR